MHTRILFFFSFARVMLATNWPVPYQSYTARPLSPERCHYEQWPFCEDGVRPEIADNDQIFVYYFTNPVMKRAFGTAFAHLNAYHSLIGFESAQLGRNFTLEYYAYGSVVNTSFPQIDIDQKTGNYQFTWCQQAASCLRPGIDHSPIEGPDESLDGYIRFLGTMTGSQFNAFINQEQVADNATYPIYNAFNVQYEPDGQIWMESMDCADFVKRAIVDMLRHGANFNYSHSPKTLRLSKLMIYSEMPRLLGDWEAIKDNSTMLRQLADFYEVGEPAKDKVQEFKRVIKMFFHLFFPSPQKIPFFYFNQQYWELKLREPFMRIIYTEWALPISE